MGRDHKKLRVFHQAHSLTIDIYKHTREFPRSEWFGLRSQIRRAAVSVGANIVEGSARSTIREYVKFLHVALGSASELQYLVALSSELGFTNTRDATEAADRCGDVVRQLQALVTRLENIIATASRQKP